MVNTKVTEHACFYVAMSLVIDPPATRFIVDQLRLDFLHYHRWYKWERYYDLLTHGRLDKKRGVSLNDLETVTTGK